MIHGIDKLNLLKCERILVVQSYMFMYGNNCSIDVKKIFLTLYWNFYMIAQKAKNHQRSRKTPTRSLWSVIVNQL